MIRFEFRLRPLAEVTPWGGGTLHWFALTDGWYWIALDGMELLRYTEATAPDPAMPYADYYVVRLWEDLNVLSPAVREPVPADLVPFIESDPDDWSVWPDDDYAHDDPNIDAAVGWFGARELDVGYLTNGPELRLWRTAHDGDRITVAWRNRPDPGYEFHGGPLGRINVPTTDFLDAVRDLDTRLIAAMTARVAEIERDGVADGIEIDVPQLRREHEARATWFAKAAADTRDTDWPAVRAGAARLLPHA